MRKPFAVLLAATVLFVPVACSSESSGDSSALASDTATPGCDDRDVRACLLPWPSDRYTVPDATTATGVRVAIPADAVPTNANGTPIDVTDQNLGDGVLTGHVHIGVGARCGSCRQRRGHRRRHRILA